MGTYCQLGSVPVAIQTDVLKLLSKYQLAAFFNQS